MHVASVAAGFMEAASAAGFMEAASAAGFAEAASAAGFAEVASAAGFAEVALAFADVALAFAGGMAATDSEGTDTEATRTDTDMGMDAGSQGHTGVSFTSVIETARAKRPAARRVFWTCRGWSDPAEWFAIGLLFVRLLCDCFGPRGRLEAEIMVPRHQLNIF
jgi:hypothetical protein